MHFTARQRCIMHKAYKAFIDSAPLSTVDGQKRVISDIGRGLVVITPEYNITGDASAGLWVADGRAVVYQTPSVAHV